LSQLLQLVSLRLPLSRLLQHWALVHWQAV